VLRLSEQDTGYLMLALVVGVGLGSVLAGIWSGGRVEVGIVPLGAIGIVVMSVGLFSAGNIGGAESDSLLHRAYFLTLTGLLLLGIAAGLFYVPLEAFLQHRSPREIRGTLQPPATLSPSPASSPHRDPVLMQDVLHVTPRSAFLVIGLATVPVAAVCAAPVAIRSPVRDVADQLHSLPAAHLWTREPPRDRRALLVANHVTGSTRRSFSSARPARSACWLLPITSAGVRWAGPRTSSA
jgi:acyl-[acyl-carrier-protein]-phospholipid O-acyltransferase/long-chain-fatty-acid--[acyl-carrier-protein] ligase